MITQFYIAMLVPMKPTIYMSQATVARLCCSQGMGELVKTLKCCHGWQHHSSIYNHSIGFGCLLSLPTSCPLDAGNQQFVDIAISIEDDVDGSMLAFLVFHSCHSHATS